MLPLKIDGTADVRRLIDIILSSDWAQVPTVRGTELPNRSPGRSDFAGDFIRLDIALGVVVSAVVAKSDLSFRYASGQSTFPYA